MKISYDFNERNVPFKYEIFFLTMQLWVFAEKRKLKMLWYAGNRIWRRREVFFTDKHIYYQRKLLYNHSGDNEVEDPPVPIPNTEVKLYVAEST